MRWRTALVFAVLMETWLWAWPCSLLLAAPLSRARGLAGVEVLQVVVEDLNPATRQTGLRKEQIQAVAEKYLSEHGMKMGRGVGGTPVAYIRLSSVIGGAGAHAPVSFYLTVQVKQLARLTRARPATPVAANADDRPLLVTTWEDGMMVMIDRKELGFYVKQVLSNLLGSLMQDLQEANGKGGS